MQELAQNWLNPTEGSLLQALQKAEARYELNCPHTGPKAECSRSRYHLLAFLILLHMLPEPDKKETLSEVFKTADLEYNDADCSKYLDECKDILGSAWLKEALKSSDGMDLQLKIPRDEVSYVNAKLMKECKWTPDMCNKVVMKSEDADNIEVTTTVQHESKWKSQWKEMSEYWVMEGASLYIDGKKVYKQGDKSVEYDELINKLGLDSHNGTLTLRDGNWDECSVTRTDFEDILKNEQLRFLIPKPKQETEHGINTNIILKEHIYLHLRGKTLGESENKISSVSAILNTRSYVNNFGFGTYQSEDLQVYRSFYDPNKYFDIFDGEAIVMWGPNTDVKVRFDITAPINDSASKPLHGSTMLLAVEAKDDSIISFFSSKSRLNTSQLNLTTDRVPACDSLAVPEYPKSDVTKPSQTKSEQQQTNGGPTTPDAAAPASTPEPASERDKWSQRAFKNKTKIPNKDPQGSEPDSANPHPLQHASLFSGADTEEVSLLGGTNKTTQRCGGCSVQ